MKLPGLTTQIFIGLALGVLVGWQAPQLGVALAPGGEIFLRLIKTIIAPLVFSTLVVGIAGAGSLHAVGRLGLKSLIYFEVVTTCALVVGLAAVNLLQPGAGVHLDPATAGAAGDLAAKQVNAGDVITHVFPSSVIDAMARGDVLQIVVFSILFAAAVSAAKAKPIIDLCQSLAEVMFKYTGYVMKLAPFGVAAAMAATVGHHGLSVLWSLGKLIGTLYLALFVFVVFVLGTVALIARVPVGQFLAAVREPVLLAFSTTSSEAALPRAMQAMERIGVPRHIVSFVLPVGYSFNLDGTTLYLSLAAIFVAQAAGIHLDVQTQLLMMLTLMLTSKGVAAVPRASLVILAGTLATFNLPLAGIALILGVDAVMDMARTAVNVLGNCLASVVLARWEGAFPHRPAPVAHEIAREREHAPPAGGGLREPVTAGGTTLVD
ncbi:MAG TPA: cation:dicarboxylase symporter family transporter [Candidatus Obscuribacterales bacterium]